jgi:erythromycin esterase-like protein
VDRGDAGLIVRDNFSYGFGALQENAELVQWMRAYNADSTHRRHVRFYGVDLSIGGPRDYTPTNAEVLWSPDANRFAPSPEVRRGRSAQI